MRTFEEIFVQYGVGGLLLASEDRIAHGLQMCFSLRTVIVVGRTTPERFLIQLNLLNVGFTVHHRSQMGIPYGQGLEPVGCRTAVPETEVLCVCGHRTTDVKQNRCCNFLHIV